MLGEAKIFSEIVRIITADNDLNLLNYIITIKMLVKEGEDRLNEEENKSRLKTHWRPKPSSALSKQLKEARDKNAPEGSIWRKIYILGGLSLKVVTILGLIANGRNLGNRNPKSRMKRSKETVDVAVENAADNADNRREEKSNSKLTLQETIKLWPLPVIAVLVEEILKITLPQKVGLWHSVQPDDSGELDVSQCLSKKRKRGEDEGQGQLTGVTTEDDESEGQLTGVTNLIRRLSGINSTEKSSIQSSQTTQMQSISVPSLLNKPAGNGMVSVARFRKIIPRWIDHTTLSVNPLSFETAGPRRIDILGNGKVLQVNVTVHGEQPENLKDMAPSQFFEYIISHLDGSIVLKITLGSGLMQISIPGSMSILTLHMLSARKLWQLLAEKD